MVLHGHGTFELAVRFRDRGAPIGELFAFVSGLYFRGKLAYARAFGRPLVIVPGLGLVPPETVVTAPDLVAIAEIGVAPGERRYTEPLERDAAALASSLAVEDIVVLLGSIATGKYVDVMEGHLGGRLHFPAEFVGRGDMSRGGLMLRSVAAGAELSYVAIPGALRHGKRPPRLTPVRKGDTPI